MYAARKFDSQPLGIGLCYSCGRVLWNPSHAHYSGLITPPSGMTPDDAPATAYLRVSPNSNLTFVHMKGNSEKWLCCPQCKKYALPPDQHVGVVFESGTCISKPVSQWNMKLANAVANLANIIYERGQVSLCGLFSTVVKDAGMSRFSHVRCK